MVFIVTTFFFLTCLLSPIFSKIEYVAFTHGFSGRSMGSLSVTHKEKYRTPFVPLIPGTFILLLLCTNSSQTGVKFAEYNDIDSAASVINNNTCAVIVEPVQGEGGVTPANPEFLRTLRALCDKFNALLIIDEVQWYLTLIFYVSFILIDHLSYSGLGRTGILWAHEHYGIKPDIMTLAKPLAGI